MLCLREAAAPHVLVLFNGPEQNFKLDYPRGATSGTLLVPEPGIISGKFQFKLA